MRLDYSRIGPLVKRRFHLLLALAAALAAPLGVAPVISVAMDKAFASKNPDIGVLLMGHGGGRSWNLAVEDVRKSVGSKYHIEVAFGMADSKEIQRAVAALEKSKVKRIVAVPLFISSVSEVMDQTRFVLGLRPTPSKEFMAHPHAHHGAGHGGPSRRISSKIPIVMTSALDDNPLVADILLDRARELSRDPAKEHVLLIGHGPLKETDNQVWLKTMDRLAAYVKQQGGFASVVSATLRDDSPPDVRKEADRILRDHVTQLGRKGAVIVVPHLIAQGGIERHIPRSLNGLFYKWNAKTLLPDRRLSVWVERSVEEQAGNLQNQGGR